MRLINPNMSDPRLRQPRNYQLIIDGETLEAVSGERYTRYSPGYGVPVGTFAQAGTEDTDRAVAAARKAFESGPWPHMKAAERSQVLARVADLIAENHEELATIETLESGKAISQARGEIQGAADIWAYAAAQTRSITGETHNSLGDNTLGLVLREPIGVIGIITPWNFPLLIASERIPFALGAGCTVVIKPSELTPGTTTQLAMLALEAGLPPGVLNIIPGAGSLVGQRLVEHTDVDMISFTGSTTVGRGVMAGAASNIKKLGLELGGKNPQVIFDDADLDAAIDATLFGAYINAGECCISGSRVIVQETIADEVATRLSELASRIPVGDPLNNETLVGAIVNPEQLHTITELVTSGDDEGATTLCGGQTAFEEAGHYFLPTVLGDVTPSMRVAREEIFGPVLSISTFQDEQEAIRIANDTAYGLSAGVWSRNLDRAFNTARRIKAGRMWINNFIESFPEMPLGGYKQSGIGREGGHYGFDEYTEVKTLNVHIGPRTDWWHPDAQT